MAFHSSTYVVVQLDNDAGEQVMKTVVTDQKRLDTGIKVMSYIEHRGVTETTIPALPVVKSLYLILHCIRGTYLCR